MLLFNEAISKLGLVELPLKGKHFTWSNKIGFSLLPARLSIILIPLLLL
jgi:hypothetical protein